MRRQVRVLIAIVSIALPGCAGRNLLGRVDASDVQTEEVAGDKTTGREILERDFPGRKLIRAAMKGEYDRRVQPSAGVQSMMPRDYYQ